MANAAYEEAFDRACSEIEALLGRKIKIEAQIRQLRKTIAALSKHISSSNQRETRLMTIFAQLSAPENRLTDAIKDALYSAFTEHGPRKLPPIQVKELLEVRGFDFKDVVNPSANVNSALRRLARQGDIKVGAERDGATVYWLDGPRFGARNSLANVLEIDRQQLRQMDEKIAKRVNGLAE